MSSKEPEHVLPSDETIVNSGTEDARELSQVERGMDRCPVCDYSLAALPSDYRCPECGFEYDRHTRVWRVGREDFGFGRVGLAALAVAAGTMVAGFCVQLVFDIKMLTGRMRPPPVFLPIVVAASAALACWRHERPRVVAVGAAGLTFRTWRRRAATLNWTDLADVSPEAVVERAWFQATTTRIETVLSQELRSILRKRAQRREVYEAMERAREKHFANRADVGGVARAT